MVPEIKEHVFPIPVLVPHEQQGNPNPEPEGDNPFREQEDYDNQMYEEVDPEEEMRNGNGDNDRDSLEPEEEMPDVDEDSDSDLEDFMFDLEPSMSVYSTYYMESSSLTESTTSFSSSYAEGVKRTVSIQDSFDTYLMKHLKSHSSASTGNDLYR